MRAGSTVSRTRCSASSALLRRAGSQSPYTTTWAPDQQRTTEPVLGPRTARTRVQGRRVAQHPGHVAWAEISAATASIAGVTEPFQVHKTQGFASLCTMARRLLIHQPGK